MEKQLLNDLFDKQMLYLADRTFTIEINGKEIVHLNSDYDLFEGDRIKQKYEMDLEYEIKKENGALKWQKSKSDELWLSETGN